MIRQDASRIDPKRRPALDYKKKQFANPVYAEHDYHHRLNLYTVPPTSEITLEQFEQWAIDRLRSTLASLSRKPSRCVYVADICAVLSEIEACSFRNKSLPETANHILPLLQRWLPLDSNSSSSAGSQDDRLKQQRRKDHYSHYILRLAFSSTEDLRRRFARVESTLFRIRFQHEDAREKQGFVESLNMDWESVSESERRSLATFLVSASPGLKWQDVEEGGWFKVDFETVPELIESRRVYVKAGKAYVPGREQMSMVLAAFLTNLERGLEVCISTS